MTRANELNFLPDGYLRRRGRRRTTVIIGAISIAVLAAVGSAAFISQRLLQRAQRAHEPVVCRFDIATRQLESLRKLRQQQRSLVQRAAMFASLTEAAAPSNVLAELTNALPAGASLLELKMESRNRQEAAAANPSVFDAKKAALEAKRRAESGAVDLPDQELTVKITGLARTDIQVARFLEALHRSPLFLDVALIVSETHTVAGEPPETLRKFQIQLTVNSAVRANAKPPAQTAATPMEP